MLPLCGKVTVKALRRVLSVGFQGAPLVENCEGAEK
jgi:hypothetical protein